MKINVTIDSANIEALRDIARGLSEIEKETPNVVVNVGVKLS